MCLKGTEHRGLLEATEAARGLEEFSLGAPGRKQLANISMSDRRLQNWRIIHRCYFDPLRASRGNQYRVHFAPHCPCVCFLFQTWPTVPLGPPPLRSFHNPDTISSVWIHSPHFPCCSHVTDEETETTGSGHSSRGPQEPVQPQLALRPPEKVLSQDGARSLVTWPWSFRARAPAAGEGPGPTGAHEAVAARVSRGKEEGGQGLLPTPPPGMGRTALQLPHGLLGAPPPVVLKAPRAQEGGLAAPARQVLPTACSSAGQENGHG